MYIKTIIVALILLSGSFSSFANPLQIEAEHYDDMQGVQLENNGTTIGYFDENDWLKYEAIDFDIGYKSMIFQVAKANNGGIVEIHLDNINGPLIGILTPENTSGWTDFEEQITSIDIVEGIHDIYLVAKNIYGVCNIDYFILAEEEVDEPVWQLVWSDEFEANDVDETLWTKIYHGNPDNNELQFYTPRPENIVVSNGTLKLIARKETFTGQGPWMDEPATRYYTSGKIETQGKISFQYGKIEAKMKLPRGKGTWPAFWMLGENYFEPGIGWPKCGEIDIMEHGQDHNYLGAAIHTEAYNHTLGTQITGTFHIDDYDTSFHVYGLIWDSNELSFNVDGYTYLKVKKEDIGDSEAEWPFDQPFWLILNHAVGGAWGGTPDDSLYPHTVEVDWVRVYENQELTSAGEVDEKEAIEVYPNPTNGMVNFNLEENDSDYFLQVQNVIGKEILSKDVTTNYATFDLTDFPAGIYILSIYKEDFFLKSFKVIKN